MKWGRSDDEKPTAPTADPSTTAPEPVEAAPTASVTLTFAQLKELLNGSKPSQQEQLDLIEAQAKATATQHRKLMRPENEAHPGISVYSREGGEVANPKGEFRCRTTWGGTDVFAELLTAQEFDLLNSVPHGSFMVDRPDGTKLPVDVLHTKSLMTGKLERCDVNFVSARGGRHNLPSMVTMLKAIHAQALAHV